MRLSRWLTLIAILVGLGCLQVAQRNALYVKGYALGDRMERIHTQETDVSWLSAQVVALASPPHLSQIAQERQLKLVAWSTLPPAALPPAASQAGTLQEQSARTNANTTRPLARITAADPAQSALDAEGSD